MTPVELRDLLQRSLGDVYTVERELGEAGMSRVFVAEESGLHRKVVIKVLPPDLAAGVSMERFRREIEVAASLQHPHIVPVLHAGIADGIVYFVMPYVRGESLRDRLRAASRIEPVEALRIAGEVADALDYAHRQGVVHRDIKPENILLEDGHAVVADFGIARAVARSTQPDSRLTGTGTFLGTPLYMSPEQATGEGEVDGRSDVYSLGCVLYEMLTGRQPFAAGSVQAVIVRHLTLDPPRPCVDCPDLPTALDDVVSRSLAIDPALRWPSAGALARELRHVEAALAAARPSARRLRLRAGRPGARAAVAAAAAALPLIVATGFWIRARAPAGVAVDPAIIAVVPFRVVGADPSLHYLREGMLDLLAAKLTGDGGARAVDPRTLLSAWRQQTNESGDLAESDARAFARRLGAGHLLLGSIVGSPSRMVISASLVGVAGPAQRLDVSVNGPSDSLTALLDRLTGQLLARQAGEGERLELLTSTSLPALQSYLAGQSAYRAGRYEQAVRDFERSLTRDSAFALAAIGLFSAAYWTPNGEPFERGKRLAWSHRDRLSARDQAYVLAWTGPRYPSDPSYQEMRAGWRLAVDRAPDRAEPWFESGDLLFHFGPIFGVSRPFEEARAAFARAVELDSSFAAPLGHLLELAAIEGDREAAMRLARLYFARDSLADVADYVRWRVAVAFADSTALRDVRRRFSVMSVVSLRRVLGISQIIGAGTADAVAAAAALRRLAVTPSERHSVLFEIHNLELNRGRPRAADSVRRELEALQGDRTTTGVVAILDALFAEGDSASAARAAADLSGGGDARGECAAALWRMLAENARVSRQPASTDLSLCDAMLRVAGAPNGAPADDASISALESALGRTGPSTFGGSPFENAARLLLTRARARRGDTRGALQVVRRRAYHHSSTVYLAASLSEEGRLAELSGDAAGAAQAYRRYLALRAMPEAAAVTDVAAIRRALLRVARQ